MRKVLMFGLLLGLVLVPSSEALGQGKKGMRTAPIAPATPQDYQALATMPGILGQVLSLDPSARSIILYVEYQVPDPDGTLAAQLGDNKPKPNLDRPNLKNPNIKKNINNPKANKGNFKNPNANKNNTSQQLMREYQQILRIPNPVQRQIKLNQFMAKLYTQQQRETFQHLQKLQKMQMQFQQQLARNQGFNGNIQGLKVPMVTLAKEFELALAPEVHVARKELEIEYDDKGFVVKRTPQEVEALRDTKLPGYKAAIEDVQISQMVYVYFGKGETKAQDRDKEEDGPANEQSQPADKDIFNGIPVRPAGPAVTALLILSEADLSTLPQQPGKKKKNR